MIVAIFVEKKYIMILKGGNRLFLKTVLSLISSFNNVNSYFFTFQKVPVPIIFLLNNKQTFLVMN